MNNIYLLYIFPSEVNSNKLQIVERVIFSGLILVRRVLSYVSIYTLYTYSVHMVYRILAKGIGINNNNYYNINQFNN